jgi:putative transposase
MVAAVRLGASQRAVARQFRVPLSVVQRWVARAGDQPLEEVDWRDRTRRPHHSPTRSRPDLEAQVLALRAQLREESDLGEHGAAAIAAALSERGAPGVPSVRTINRILLRHGAFDGRRRVRRPAPPLGWHLPQVAAREAEVDAFDTITDLVIEGGEPVEVLTGVSLHGGLIGCWPMPDVRTAAVRAALEAHWRTFGCPSYAQFDNDTLFQGPHQHADAIGTVTRLCLHLNITPVFTPPRETGFQAAVESLNYRWEQAVWHRWHHSSLESVQEHSARYVAAVLRKRHLRQEAAPPRRPFPEVWTLDLSAQPQGQVIFLRRTDHGGAASLLGHRFPVDPHWLHRLVRAEVSLPEGPIRFFALRRRDPSWQPLLQEVPYRLPEKRSLR